MVQLTLFPDNAPQPRWIAPPWTAESEDWLMIDRDLPPDERARQIAAIDADLDLSALIRSYAGLGSPSHPPELLVRLILFAIDRGRLSPAQWARDCRLDDAVKWLLFGLRPSRSCLYQFRDRVGPISTRGIARSSRRPGPRDGRRRSGRQWMGRSRRPTPRGIP
jgi:hypothetical protein